MLAHVCLFHFLSRQSDACSSMRTKSGFVCVNMSTNLRVCACVCVSVRGQWCSVNVVGELRLFSDRTLSN